MKQLTRESRIANERIVGYVYLGLGIIALGCFLYLLFGVEILTENQKYYIIISPIAAIIFFIVSAVMMMSKPDENYYKRH